MTPLGQHFFVYVKLSRKSLDEWTLVFTSFGKNPASSQQTRNSFGTDSRGMFEWWIPNTTTKLHFKCCFSQSQLLPSLGQNISKKWLCNLFFNEDFNISLMIFHSQSHVDHTLGEKKNCYVIISFFTRQTFFKNVQHYIFLIKLILGLKTNNRLRDNKNWEPLFLQSKHCINDHKRNDHLCKILFLVYRSRNKYWTAKLTWKWNHM